MAPAIATGRRPGPRGFTLLELVIVLSILGLLLAGVIAVYGESEQRARERALRETLQIMRDAIDAYRDDHGTYPDSLRQLVSEEYLSRIPEDPITRSAEWVEETGVTPEGAAGVWDVHSRSDEAGRDGVPYAEW